MVWHIWWAAIACALVMLIAIIVLSSVDDNEYCITAEEVEAIEAQRLRDLQSAPTPPEAEGVEVVPGAPLQGSLS